MTRRAMTTADEQANRERSEDLAWMADHWETPREAARRLGISLAALEKWANRRDPDVLERLRRNEQVRKGAA